MSTRCAIAVFAVRLSLLALSGPAVVLAQGTGPRFELTPFAGYRIGGEFDELDSDGRFETAESQSEGLIFDIRQRADAQWEILYAHQSTQLFSDQGFPPTGSGLDLDVDYLHFGGTVLFAEGDVRPFVAMTVGLTRFEPHEPLYRAESYFSASIGGGVQLRADRRVGIRLEGRVYASLIDDDGGIFCGSVGGAGFCAVRIDGKALYQWEARAGLVFRF